MAEIELRGCSGSGGPNEYGVAGFIARRAKSDCIGAAVIKQYDGYGFLHLPIGFETQDKFALRV